MSELYKLGLTTAVVCSTPFMSLGRTQARTFGVPELPLIEIPHGLGSLLPDDIVGRADLVVPPLLQLIKEHIK